jgi:large subunit ribosomal protein L23
MNEEKLYSVIVAPHVSEKGTRTAEKHRQVVFEVRRDATKPEIKAAIEKMFNVQVDTVTVTNVRGKRKQSGRIAGRRADWKKAYVKLKAGQDIDFLGQQA